MATMRRAGEGRSAPSDRPEPGRCRMPARAWSGRLQGNAATPRGWEAFARMAFDIDVRHVLAVDPCPDLIIHAAGDLVCDVENARFLASTSLGASYVELPGERPRPVVRP